MVKAMIVLGDGTIVGGVWGINETEEARHAAADVVYQTLAALKLDQPKVARAFLAMLELAVEGGSDANSSV